MGRNSSGVRGGLQPGDGNFKGSISGVESLKNIRDIKVYRATAHAISRYHSVLGVRQREVKLADLPDNTYGAHLTQMGKSKAIYLNKKHFNKSYKEIEASHRKGYASGWSTKTNKPVAHTVTHELAHATWNEHLSGTKHKAAGREIKSLYKTWMKDKSKKGYGTYAKTNVSEFWAETTTKAVHGNADKYTREVKRIIKKYKL